MKTKLSIVILLSALALLYGTHCGKESKDSARQTAGSADRRSAPEAPGRAMEDQAFKSPTSKASGGPKKRASDEGRARKEVKKLDIIFVAPFEEARDRLLEYSIQLDYRTRDFKQARLELLKITSKYGFVMSSSASTHGRKPYMHARIHVRVEKIIEVLQELDKIGNLLSESTNVHDHTEEWFRQALKARREAIRAKRKAKLTSVAPTSENWEARVRSQERSEDELDRARHERWKIKDRTSWAKINISLRGPDQPPSIQIPNYEKALIGLMNLFLEISYVLLWLSPLLILIFLLLLWRRRIIGLFTGRKDAGAGG